MVRGTFSPARAWRRTVGPASTRTLGRTKKSPSVHLRTSLKPTAPMPNSTFLLIPLALACTGALADNCDSIREQLESKIKSSGVTSFTVTAIDVGATVQGKVVGSCANGTKKLVYFQRASPAASVASSTGSVGKPATAAKKPSEAVLTECKDGTLSAGGNCKK